jgi:hypothetical protein
MFQTDEGNIVAHHYRPSRYTALDADAHLTELPGQDLFGPVLRQAGLKLPTGTDPGERDLTHHIQLRIEDPGVMKMLGGTEYAIERASALEDLERARLQGSCACLMMWLWPPLNNPGVHAVTSEVDRREQSRGSRTDHEHIETSGRHSSRF